MLRATFVPEGVANGGGRRMAIKARDYREMDGMND
jgi:hypothetical protein